ncbi:hypothetical protein V8J82_07865 [Gymnodinialimonas sp. 2305UL16-5]|uniref:hypothetical protein n=1 Tax=Gymnodinialimonas mytili TaxID=3126503 RepID=UPI0030ABFFCB
MFNYKLGAFLAALGTAAFATAAQAVPVTISFDGLGAQNNQQIVNVGDVGEGVNLSIDADTFRRISFAPAGPARTYRLNGDTSAVVNTQQGSGDQGLGVLDEDDFNDDVDGFGDNDILLFSFSRSVNLLSITFDNVNDALFGNGPDDFLGFASAGPIDPSDTFTSIIRDIPNVAGDDGVFTIAAPGVAGSFFGIGAIGNNDSWRIRSLTVDIAPVPLPAALPMLAFGIGGLMMVGRRRRRAAAA